MGTILGVSEIAVFLVLAGGHNTISVFGTGHTPSGYKGITGVIAGSVYTVLAFGGFEGAAPLAEESRNPKRTVQKAVLFSTLGIGIFYVFTTYAADVAFGPAGFSGFTSSGASSWAGMARSLYGLFWFFVFLAIVNSTIGALPAALARVHPRHRSPVLAIALSFVLTVAVLLGLGLAYNPVNGFAMTGTGIVIVLVAIYILMNVACIGYFARAANRRGRRWSVLLHLIVPVLGIVVFVPAWLTAAGIKVFSFVVPLAAPASYMAPGVAGFMVLGIIYLGYLYAKHPRTVTEVGLVHLDDPDSGPVAESTVAEGCPADERPQDDHVPAGGRRVRLDLRRRGPRHAATHAVRARAVHRGLLRGPGPVRRRSRVAAEHHRAQPADRPLLDRGGRARRHGGGALRVRDPRAGLGGVDHGAAVRRADRDAPDRAAHGTAGRGHVDLGARPRQGAVPVHREEVGLHRRPADGPHARHGRRRASRRRGALRPGARRVRREHGHAGDARGHHVLPRRRRARGAAVARRRARAPGRGRDLRCRGRVRDEHGAHRGPDQGHRLGAPGDSVAAP